MTSKINNGGPAFSYGDHVNGGDAGMSLRDWFAGQALRAIIEADGIQYSPEMADHARFAYLQADAMLKARELPEAPHAGGKK